MPAFSMEERQLLHESLHDFLGDRYTFEHFKKVARSPDADGFSRAEWSEYANLGWLGVALPESASGSGGGLTELGIVMAAAGHFLLLEPFLGTVVLGAGAIEAAGTADQNAMLADIASGNTILAFCHAEPGAGFSRDHVKTIARQEGGSFVIDGEKGFALHAHGADTLVVSARLGSETGPVVLFLVPRDADGVEIMHAPALDGRRGAAIKLAGVKLAASARLGDTDADRTGLIDQLYDRGAIAVCAEAVGAMASVNAKTVEYLKTREQFGQPLSKFQVLQHRLVDMSVACEEARALVQAALQALDEKRPDASKAVWTAKVQTARSARFVGGQGVQLHGGMGMTDELSIGHYYKRLSMCETMFGDADWYLAKIGDEAA